MAQPTKLTIGKVRLPISLHIASLPDSETSFQVSSSPAVSRLSSPVLLSPSLRNYKRKPSRTDPAQSAKVPPEPGPALQVTNSRCESTLETPVLRTRFDFPTTATEPAYVRNWMRERPLKPRPVLPGEKGAFLATLPPLPGSYTEVLVRRSLGQMPSDWLRTKVSLHRLAVEFNPGARIRLTRKLQPRLRSLLYKNS